MTTEGKKDVIVILGPTASGKTSLSVALAKALDTEIISGDSMLVYRGFDIGTAKPTKEEMQGVRHALIDVCDPMEPFNVTKFQQLASAEIDRICARGRIPIVAGGTGLYIQALLEGYSFNEASADEAYRSELERLGEVHGKAYVHHMLEAVDPDTAARLHVNDFRRVIRALEVCREGQEKISTQKEGMLYHAYVIGLQWDRVVLYERINQRVDLMMQAGFLEEVQALLASGVSRAVAPMKSLGYRELAAYTVGEMTLAQAVYETKKATRHFAKRQGSWYRRIPYIHWYDAEHTAFTALRDRILTDIDGFFGSTMKPTVHIAF